MHSVNNNKMEYQVLSRKYRPQKFDEIVGQSHIVSTLIKSIDLNRVAHGYLLSGLRGSGKTTIARVYQKLLTALIKILIIHVINAKIV